MEQAVATRPATEVDWGPFSLRGKNAVITGGAMGIGHGIVQRFREGGANVVVADLDIGAATAVAAETDHKPGAAVAFQLDVSKEDECERAIFRCVEQFGSLDILVNDAGIFPTRNVLEMTPEFFDRVLAVNLRGLVFMSKTAGVQMVKQGRGGTMVNIASVDALHPSMTGLAAYDASKGGVLMFTKNFALEMAAYGVRVNAIAPGGVNTEGTAKPLQGMDPQAMQQMQSAFASRIPMHRMGTPDDIAKVAVFLASEASSYMTGSLVVVDGGVLLA